MTRLIQLLKPHSHLMHKLGLSLSFLCAIHCLATPFIITFLPFLGGEFFSEGMEKGLFVFSILMAAIVLFRDLKIHKDKRPFYLLAFAVLFNVISMVLHNSVTSHFWVIASSVFLAFAFLFNWRLHNKVCHHS